MNSNQITNKEELVKLILKNDENLDQGSFDEELLHKLISDKISKNINEFHEENLTLGQKMADRIALFGGSWPFIIMFGLILASWVMVNTILLRSKPFDPYPYILLNLVLSCLAAIQAPIIMMSQNRQADKDRLSAANDYLVNIKSEIIIEDLHKKIDDLLAQNKENKRIQERLLGMLQEQAEKNKSE